jgi:hypothetical protein
MEHLILDLKERLNERRENEYGKIEKSDTLTDKESILISTGKILELEFLINSINEMIVYFEKTKNFEK